MDIYRENLGFAVVEVTNGLVVIKDADDVSRFVIAPPQAYRMQRALYRAIQAHDEKRQADIA